MTFDPDQIQRDQTSMETARSGVEGEWRDVAAYMLPSLADMMDSPALNSRIQQRPRTERIFDSTARLDLRDGCSVVEGEVMPSGSTWQKLEARDEELMKKHHVALWFEQLTRKVHALRNSTYSGFAQQANQSVKSLLAFGNQGMWLDYRRDAVSRRAIGIAYCSERLGQLYVRRDSAGNVETTHRKFTLTHRQAIDKWPDNPPECAAKASRDGSGLDGEASYLHVIGPNRSHDPERIDWQGKPFASCYYSESDKQVFDFGGYRTRRLILSTFDRDPGMDWGRGPGMDIMPDVRACQAMMRDLITAIEFMARPALGATDDMLDQILMYEPGGVTYGAMNERGNPAIQRLWEDPDIGPALQLLADTRKQVGRAFFQDLYMIREEVKTHVSAFERMKRDQQKGVLLSPLKRCETEWFNPMLEVELDLMLDMGMLDDMPREVMEAGGLYQVVYDNPLSQSLDAGMAANFYGMLDGLSPLMQLDPQNTVPQFFAQYPFSRLLPALARVHGVPVAWEATDEEKAQDAEQAKALADKASLLEVGLRASEIAKNLGQAGALPPPAQAA